MATSKKIRYVGIVEVARQAGVSPCHVSMVIRRQRPGSRKVWDAIESLKVRDAVTGRLVKRPARAVSVETRESPMA